MGLLELLKSLAGIEEWDFSDRRAALRIPCQIEAKIVGSKKESPVQIVDLGMRGLRLLFQGKVRKGSTVTLAHPKDKGNPITCKVEWKKESPQGLLVGASFQDSHEAMSQGWLLTELKAIGQEAADTQQRRAGIRIMCNCAGKLRVDGELREVTLIDLGLGGTLIAGPGDSLKTGQQVRLEFGPLKDLARVAINCEIVAAYKRDIPRYGLRFDSFFDGGVTDLERYLTYFYASDRLEQTHPPETTGE